MHVCMHVCACVCVCEERGRFYPFSICDCHLASTPPPLFAVTHAASAVTTFSAFMCLKHVLKHNAQSSPILRSLAASQHMKQQRATVLPVGKGDQLSKDLFMILHSRNCQEVRH